MTTYRTQQDNVGTRRTEETDPDYRTAEKKRHETLSKFKLVEVKRIDKVSMELHKNTQQSWVDS